METLQLSPTRTNRSDKETGLAIRNTYDSNSGLKYIEGIRDFEDLKIVEGVSKGTGNIFLTSLMVFDKNSTLIYDAKIERQTSYSRELARSIVLKGLLKMLRDATKKANRPFDSSKAYELLDKKLKLAYFETSYGAVLRWYEQICQGLT